MYCPEWFEEDKPCKTSQVDQSWVAEPCINHTDMPEHVELSPLQDPDDFEFPVELTVRAKSSK